MNKPTIPEKSDRDFQQSYDESIQAYTQSADGVSDDPASNEDANSTLNVDFEPKNFSRNFKKFSVDFHDRENGAPGIDNDFGIMQRQPPGHPAETGDVLVNSPAAGVQEPNLELRSRVLEALVHADDVDSDDLDADTDDGIVYLKGSVPETWMRVRANEAVGTVLGVNRIVDQIQVNNGSES